MKKENNDLDFNLENKNNLKTVELDLLLNEKEKVDKNEYHQINNLIKPKQIKEKRLQTYITNELYSKIEEQKKIFGINKDSEIIEVLLKIVLGVKE